MKILPVFILTLTTLSNSANALPIKPETINQAQADQTSVQQAMGGKHRSDKNIARNQYRHPEQTLSFFGLKADMTVVEVWPGGGWYTEILAPTLKDQGQYYAAGFSLVAKRTPNWRKNYQRKFEKN